MNTVIDMVPIPTSRFLVSTDVSISCFSWWTISDILGLSDIQYPLCISHLFDIACSDLLVTVFTVPFKILVKLHDLEFCLGLSACYLHILADVCGNVASILNLLLVSLDRYV